MGLRGPSPVDLGALKLLTTQWACLLFGLRDGHPDLLQRLVWQPWNQTGVRIGIAGRIGFARIVSARGKEPEKVILIHEQWVAEMTRGSEGQSESFAQQPVRHIQEVITLPESSQFGSSGSLYFPPISFKPELWEQLKHPRSMKDTKQTINSIFRWMRDVSDVFETYRLPEGQEAELYRATRLWNYPKDKERPTSDNKRIEFFAKALAGLMLGISPATATKRLSHWKLLQLWKVLD